jgi:cation:H+ antiporter
LTRAVAEEELELEPAIHPQRGRVPDVVMGLAAVLVVVGASIVMERSASTLGAHLELSGIVVGALVLAGVTSLPNAVAAVYLARRGLGTATLSTALNSNTLNVAIGLLLPATVAGLSEASGSTTLVVGWYFGLTLFALVTAYIGRGLRRAGGALIIAAYLIFAVLVAAA